MSKDTRIFLTGATGLIGGELSKMLNSKFSNVSALYRSKKLELNEFEWIKFDISKDPLDRLDDCLKRTDIVIHNAGSLKIGRNSEEIKELQQVNIDFTRNLLDRMSKYKVGKIIFTSSLSTIKKPLPNLITESSVSAPVSYYSKSKYSVEELIKECSEKYGLAYTIMRIASPIASHLDAMPDTVVKKWIEAGIAGKTILVYGSGERTQDFVSVSDIANAFLCSIKNPEVSGVFNIASGYSISMLELAQLITTKFGNKYEFANIDENENDRWNVSISKAREQLLFKPQYTSREAIEKLLDSIEL